MITGEYPPMRGGVADYTSLLAAGLHRQGVGVTVLTSARAGSGSRPAADSVAATVQEWGTGLWREVDEQVARSHPDVIHIQYQTGAFGMKVGVNLFPWINRLRGGRAPVVVTFHDLKEPFLLPKIGPARHVATVALAAGCAAVVVTNPEDFNRVAGRSSSDRTRLLWGRRKVIATPIGSNIPALAADFDRPRTRERMGARGDEFLIAFFGFVNPSKGLETLVDAFETLIERGRKVRLLMVGAAAGDSDHPDRPYENSIRRRLDAPMVRGRVTWTGFLHPADVASYLSASDVCCLPFRDGVSLRHGTLIAAIELGLPIVTTSGPGAIPHERFPNLVSGRNAILIPPGAARELTEAIDRLIADQDLRRTLAAGSRSLAGAFGWDAISSATVNLYDELRSGTQAGGQG